MNVSEKNSQPLASRMRPKNINEFIGQTHLLGAGKPLRRMIENHILYSLILWGPPGSGKTTLAKLLAENINARVVEISAVLSGVNDIRKIVEGADVLRSTQNQTTVLFVDEIHRFNKSQQDAFLPSVENGSLVLIGATTQNPSYELNNALLSRLRVYSLKRMQPDEVLQVIINALSHPNGLGEQNLIFLPDLRKKLVYAADGDARQALNLLEICADFAVATKDGEVISEEIVEEVMSCRVRRFDKYGNVFYDQISALHKSVRGSSPDAALYWFYRMIDGGCDPEYIVRRVVRMASEDIGNADPRALTLALSAWQAYERLGSPEGELAIAQAIIYLAVAPKSNACYVASNDAMADVKKYGSLEVPAHLRNAPINYKYAHDEENAYVAGEKYFPNNMPNEIYYKPVPRGLEIEIRRKLELLKKLDDKANTHN